MSTYAVEIEFGSLANPEEIKQWFDMLMDAMPEGAEGKIVQRPLIVDVTKLTSQYAGSKIKIFIPHLGNVEGILEEVYRAGRHEDVPRDAARTLIIDGIAYTVTYGVAQLGEW